MMNVFEKIREKFANIHRVVTCDEDLEWNRAVYECEKLVNQVEQEHNNGWIPCSKRLPDKYDEYLCVNKYGSYILGYPYRNKADEDLIMVETENEIMLEVIAWQPLPQPYKERDTNGN